MTAPAAAHAHGREYAVVPLELLFDLVFVFAVSQLSHHLVAELSLRGAAETLVMLLAVFSVWYYTSWEATTLRADRAQTVALVLTVMPLSLLMNASISEAFTSTGWFFVVPLLVIQLGTTLWARANSQDAGWRTHHSHTFLWLVISTPFWIVGAAVDSDARLLWWAIAAAVDMTGFLLSHPIPGKRLRLTHNAALAGGHMLERCRLFLIIALGETIITVGGAIAEQHVSAITIFCGVAALAGTVALWGLFFGGLADLIQRHVEGGAADPIRATANAGNALFLMVAGLVAVAVANELVIAHPHEQASLTLVLLMFGGPLLFILALGGYVRWVLESRLPWSVIIGAATLVPAGLVALLTPSFIALGICSGILVATAVLGGYSGRLRARSRAPQFGGGKSAV